MSSSWQPVISREGKTTVFMSPAGLFWLWRGRLCDKWSFRELLLLPAAPLSAELRLKTIFSPIRACLAGSALLYQCNQTVFNPRSPFQTMPVFYLSAVEGWNEGHAGFGPTCLRWGLPPLFAPCFLWRIFHIFVLVVVLGTGHGLRSWEPPVAFLNPCLVGARQEFFPTAHIVCFVHTWDIFTAVK